MSTSIGEFFVDLVVDAGKGELTVGNLVKSMGELEVASVGEIAVLAELADKLAQITDAAIKSALGFHTYTAQTGASTKALQEWQSAARHTAAGADVVEPALLGISEQLEDIQRFGQGSHAPIRNLVETLKDVNFEGLDPKKPEELLRRIRESTTFKAMTAPDQFGILRHAGLADMLELLTMKQQDFLKYSKETTPMSEREIEKYQKIHNSMASIEAIAANIKRLIADWSSDAVISFLDKTAKTLQLELDSLAKIKEFFETRKTGETVTGRTKELLPAAKGELPGLFMNMIRAGLFGSTGFLLPQTVGAAVPPSSNYVAPTYTPRATAVNFNPTTNINGTSLNEHQLRGVVKGVFDDLLQQLPAQIDPLKLR